MHVHTYRCTYSHRDWDLRRSDPFSVFTFLKAAVFAINSKDSYDKHTTTHKTMNERLDS